MTHPDFNRLNMFKCKFQLWKTLILLFFYCSEAEHGCIMCVFVFVCVCVCDFVKYFGRSRLNKKWNDKAAVPYLLHGGHLKAWTQRKSVRVCRSAVVLHVWARSSSSQSTKCLWFLLLLYLFIHLFICSLVSGITSELWNSPLSLLK